MILTKALGKKSQFCLANKFIGKNLVEDFVSRIEIKPVIGDGHQYVAINPLPSTRFTFLSKQTFGNCG
jgi:hypothetical protein